MTVSSTRISATVILSAALKQSQGTERCGERKADALHGPFQAEGDIPTLVYGIRKLLARAVQSCWYMGTSIVGRAFAHNARLDCWSLDADHRAGHDMDASQVVIGRVRGMATRLRSKDV